MCGCELGRSGVSGSGVGRVAVGRSEVGRGERAGVGWSGVGWVGRRDDPCIWMGVEGFFLCRDLLILFYRAVCYGSSNLFPSKGI